ncbi:MULTISPECIES: hypothetical protein [unclassified Bradyrhizobium]|uniref:hypothetical protein n=2 Tax=Bradyrhizobium TaxID=374 RepID=UPI001FF1B971|nr:MULTISPECIES: hypothetical protein [unclassified Bradyrhizobium]MCJ9700384.1 hypothetical protein [Bradyrhizobium sp. SHOUNA76]MCJ9733318.1 hypothetical protein [Bradyrhizobium sp. PRIMUS42]
MVRHVFARHVKENGMQEQSRPLLRVISWLRAVRVHLIAPDPAAREASPLLILTVVVLALLLAILEVELHSADLQSLGLIGDAFPIDPVFKSP